MADTATTLYCEATPKALKGAPKIWDAMTKIQDRLIKNIRSHNFEKFISVAHKDNGDDFFHEVLLLSLCFQFFFQFPINHIVLDISFLHITLICGRLIVISPPSSSLI